MTRHQLSKGLTMKFRTLVLGVFGASLLAGAADAHHSFAMYDSTKYTTLQGTVKAYTWRNPHAMLDFSVQTPQGEELWSVELSAPNIIGRRGWSAKSLKVGDKIPLVLHPMKDGTKFGLMVSVTTPTGQVLKDKA